MLKEQLTIIIPTYNRCDSLKETLNDLCLKNIDQVKIIVLDNNSTDNTESLVRECKAKYEFIDYKKNKVNIGLNANLLRTIEICETEWLWMLGDDDKINDDCLSKIELKIRGQIDSVLINFSNISFVERNSDLLSSGLDEFLCIMDSFPNLLFISTNIMNAKILKKNISLGYQYSYSMIPYFIMLLDILKNSESKVHFSKQSIVEFRRPEKNEKWSFINLWMGLPTLIEAIPGLSKSNINIISEKIFCEVYLNANFFYNIFMLYQDDENMAKYISRQILYRYKDFLRLSFFKFYLIIALIEIKLVRQILFLFSRVTYRSDLNKLNTRIA